MTEYDNWCRNLFATLADGGTWAVPRSGLIFQKQSGMLVLIDQMPHSTEMPITREQLIEQQQSDFEVNRKYFGAVGIAVVKGMRK